MEIIFETRRLYVAARKSVLFFARVGDQRVRCYVQQDALVEAARGLREEADLYQRCLLSFDQHRDAIQAAAMRLIEASVLTNDGAVIVSSTALTLEAHLPILALESVKG
jgi:Protein of unknown function (DUF1488)